MFFFRVWVEAYKTRKYLPLQKFHYKFHKHSTISLSIDWAVLYRDEDTDHDMILYATGMFWRKYVLMSSTQQHFCVYEWYDTTRIIHIIRFGSGISVIISSKQLGIYVIICTCVRDEIYGDIVVVVVCRRKYV